MEQRGKNAHPSSCLYEEAGCVQLPLARDGLGSAGPVFMLTGRQAAECTAGATLLEQMPRARILHGDKGYDTDIPPQASRRWKTCFLPALYHGRDVMECTFCGPKDSHRVATRYDRLAVNFPAAVCIAATVSYWS